MSAAPAASFIYEESPDHPGWYTWNLRDATRFNGQILGPMRVRRDEDGKARIQMDPTRRHTNLADNLHGGIVLSLIDVSLFGASRMYGLIEAGTAVTLDLSVQFIGAGKADRHSTAWSNCCARRGGCCSCAGSSNRAMR